jgi:hypothetical protein
MKMGRDLLGRVSGILLFAAFLSFHVWFVGRAWHALILIAKINSLLISGTITLFLASYFLRTKAVSYSKGFMETIYPLLCSALPLVIFHNNEILKLFPPHSRFAGLLNSIFGIHGHILLRWDALPTALVIIGNSVTLIGIIYLKRSFSIMAEARQPVYCGIYKHMRHPLYFGEGVATAGILFFRWSKINIALTALFLVGQIVRAGIEENKLMFAFPEYKAYKHRTGAFFPRLRVRE